MANASHPLSAQDAERLRRFERERHDSLAATYVDFFTPITALAIQPLLDAAGARVGSNLLDIATGPGSVAAKARAIGSECRTGGLAKAKRGSTVRSTRVQAS